MALSRKKATTIALDPEGALAGVVFEVKSDPHVGKVCTARILRQPQV